jgi:tetratricopeptide (TPR) repeat protein
LLLPPRQKIPLLEHALEASRRLSDKGAEGVHLGNLGNAYADLGDARKAIELYEQCLILHREIGDRRGEGAALGNLGNAYADLGEKEKAREHWQQALAIFRVIESPHVKTVEGWLAGLDGGGSKKQQVSIQDFARAVILAHRAKPPQAAQYFDMLGKLTRDDNSPPEIQQLGRVLQKYISGVENPDLSGLPKELAQIVREELG